MMTDKERYEKLKQYLINLSPYCDSCANKGNDNRCDECKRKSFNWKFDEKVLEQLFK